MTTESLRTGAKQGSSHQPTQRQLEALKPTQFQPGQTGNAGGRPKTKSFTIALLRIVEKQIVNDPDGRVLLDVIAQQLVAKASKGDLASIRELADRIEGKPLQRQEFGGPNGQAIPFMSLSRQENEKRIMELMAKAGGPDRDSTNWSQHYRENSSPKI